MNLLSAIDNRRCYFDNDSLLESDNFAKVKFRLKSKILGVFRRAKKA